MVRTVTDYAAIPSYGSARWHALPETDRRRIAAVVAAAEYWVAGKDDLIERLRRGIADGRAAL